MPAIGDSSDDTTTRDDRTRRHARLWRAAPPLLLIVCAALAISSAIGDSITFDEFPHLTSGLSYLETGDFRLPIGSPPLGQAWAALPLLLFNVQWPPADDPAFLDSDVYGVGRRWFYDLNNGERLLIVSRCAIVVLLLAACWITYRIACRVFDRRAGLLALALAALSPTMLAHGRLTTVDMAITLCMILTLLAFARMLERVSVGTVVVAAISLAVAALVKFSWVILIPSTLVMGAVAIVRSRPMNLQVRSRVTKSLARRSHRAMLLMLLALVFAATTWVAIWSAYLWRYSPFARGASAATHMPYSPSRQFDNLEEGMAGTWHTLLTEVDGTPLRGVTPAVIRFARRHRLLPEAYLHGVAFIHQTRHKFSTYMLGRVSVHGNHAYFPLVFLIKTPIPTLALFAVGLLVIAGGRLPRIGDMPLLAGIVTLALLYGGGAIASNLNIGQRHLLPIYPIVFIVAGAAAYVVRGRVGKIALGVALAWLAVADARIAPHYLSYFNEIAGGPANGYLYLADSNIDWGQDLKRLAKYARRHPTEHLNVCYFGSADPTRYGFDCHVLPGGLEKGDKSTLEPGTYVFSITELLSVYEWVGTEETWRIANTHNIYRQLYYNLPEQPPADPADLEPWRTRREQFELLRWGRFLHQLRRRPADERIGYSMFVFKLDADEIEVLTRPAAPQ